LSDFQNVKFYNHKLKFDVYRRDGIVHTSHIINSFKCLELVLNFEQILDTKVRYFLHLPINRGNSNVKKYTYFLHLPKKILHLYFEYYHLLSFCFLLFIISLFFFFFFYILHPRLQWICQIYFSNIKHVFWYYLFKYFIFWFFFLLISAI